MLSAAAARLARCEAGRRAGGAAGLLGAGSARKIFFIGTVTGMVTQTSEQLRVEYVLVRRPLLRTRHGASREAHCVRVRLR